ncbi:MAG: hypothetical protein KDA81_21445 [Planctomycetaceae bacterium]|nr:hypothetical protein [Planctomycetaceae bacterium]
MITVLISFLRFLLTRLIADSAAGRGQSTVGLIPAIGTSLQNITPICRAPSVNAVKHFFMEITLVAEVVRLLRSPRCSPNSHESGYRNASQRCPSVFRVLWLIVLTTAVFTSPVDAGHPISVTEAQIYVTRTSARVRIQLFAEDLFLFHNLEPDAEERLSADQLREGLQLHRQFLLDKVTLRDAAGEAFPGSVTDVQPFEIPPDGIPVDELMLHSAVYELEFPFAEPPEFLTVQQDISDENFIFPSEMKMTLHQAGTELTYSESLKPGEAQTIRFDWSGETLGDDASDEQWKAWLEKQREATLGITSYSSVYSFIYIEPAEVRHEILIPLASLKTFLPIVHSDPAFVDINEQESVRSLIINWLKDANPVTINGTTIAPDFTRIDFYGLDLKDFAQQAKERRISLANGRVGIIMTYHAPFDRVESTTLQWNTFNSAIRKIHSVMFIGVGTDEPQRFEFSRFNEEADNIVRWEVRPDQLRPPARPVVARIPERPMLTIPVLSAAIIGLSLLTLLVFGRQKRRVLLLMFLVSVVVAPFFRVRLENPFRSLPPIAHSDQVFQELLHNAYDALEFGTEDRIYDALEQCVDGSLLENLYLQLRQGLQMREQGGAVARVRSLEFGDGQQVPVINGQPPWPGFQYRSQWVVSGTVEHWGHIHERQNQFSATFSVEPRDGLWKITDMQIQDQQSLGSKTSLRKF